jgi:hypothetical protein
MAMPALKWIKHYPLSLSEQGSSRRFKMGLINCVNLAAWRANKKQQSNRDIPTYRQQEHTGHTYQKQGEGRKRVDKEVIKMKD